MKLFPVLISLVSLSMGVSCTKDVGPNPDLIPKTTNNCDTVKYSLHIQPIIIAKCATPSCHAAGFFSGDFTGYSGVKAKVDNGTFNNRVLVLKDMPLGGPPLQQEEINLIKCWLENGAPNN